MLLKWTDEVQTITIKDPSRPQTEPQHNFPKHAEEESQVSLFQTCSKAQTKDLHGIRASGVQLIEAKTPWLSCHENDFLPKIFNFK